MESQKHSSTHNSQEDKKWETEEREGKKWTKNRNNKMAYISINVVIITLNVAVPIYKIKTKIDRMNI